MNINVLSMPLYAVHAFSTQIHIQYDYITESFKSKGEGHLKSKYFVRPNGTVLTKSEYGFK